MKKENITYQTEDKVITVRYLNQEKNQVAVQVEGSVILLNVSELEFLRDVFYDIGQEHKLNVKS